MRNGKRLIMIIDDDEAALQLLIRFFHSKDCETLAAPTAIDALPLLSYDIDLIVTDYDMPGLSGFDFRVMVARRLPLIPVVVITGLEAAENTKFIPIFQGVLIKPFRLLDLWNLALAVWAGKGDGHGAQGSAI